MSRHLYSWEDDRIPEVYTPEYGIGLLFENKDGIQFITTKPHRHYYKDDKRIVSLEISTWRNTMAIGATHYYATIKFYGADDKRVDGEEYHYSNYSCIPSEAETHSIKVCREVTQKDVTHAKKMGWEACLIPRSGDHTHGYWTEEEALKAGIDFFNEKFGDGWVLVDEYDNDRVLATK